MTVYQNTCFIPTEELNITLLMILQQILSLTADISEATHTYIYRFKPTYIVSRVTDAANDSLKSGDFIIAGDAEVTLPRIAQNGLDRSKKCYRNILKRNLMKPRELRY